MQTKKPVREERYIVFKKTDVVQLNPAISHILDVVQDEVFALRGAKGKPPLVCLCIESDWPEYEPTWGTLLARVAAERADANSQEERYAQECEKRQLTNQERLANHEPYITITNGMRGYFAVMMHWNKEGGFYEPYNTGLGSYETYKEVIPEAKAWAEADGVVLVISE